MKKTFIVCLVVLLTVFTQISPCALGADDVIAEAGGVREEMPSSLIAHGISLIFSAFSGSGKGVIANCAAILALCVVSAITASFKNSFPPLGTAGEYISILALSGAVFGAVNNVVALVEQATLRFVQYLLTLLPVMTAMYAYGGSNSAAISSATSVNLFCTVITVICNTVLTPLVNICLTLSLTSALPGCGNIHPISNGIKNLSSSLTAFVFSILGFAVSVQTVISAAGETYATRTIRFASGVFIPVIGSMVGEASRTILASVKQAKSVIGSGGIIAVITLMIPPVAVVVLYKMGILLCAAAAKMMGCEKESAFLYDINGIFGILLAVTVGSTLVGLLAITVFVCTGAAV